MRAAMNGTTAFIGAGHITEMILGNYQKTGILAACGRILVSDVNKDRSIRLHERFGVHFEADNRESFASADVIFLCVPPQMAAAVIDELKGADAKGKLMITVAAGVPIAALERISPDLAVVRTLPNPPSQIGYGILPLACGANVTAELRETAVSLLRPLGRSVEMGEDGINIVTALSSPAPVFLFLESMVEAGVLCGLSRDSAELVAKETVIGCLKICENRPEASFADLIAEASTPGGTSVESLYVLDRYAWRAAIKEAYRSAAEKARRTSSEYL